MTNFHLLQNLARIVSQAFILAGLLTSALYAGPELGSALFTYEGRQLEMQNIQCGIMKIKGKNRIIIGGQDKVSKVQMALALDIPEIPTTEFTADTRTDDLTFTMKSAFGQAVVLPSVQFARGAGMEYVEKTTEDTGQWEDDPRDNDPRIAPNGYHQKNKRKIRKVRPVYKKVKPAYLRMSKEERIRTGKGVFENRKFRDTYFMVHLKPVLDNQGKITEFSGTFTGIARTGKGREKGKNGVVQGGAFKVKVNYVQ